MKQRLRLLGLAVCVIGLLAAGLSVVALYPEQIHTSSRDCDSTGQASTSTHSLAEKQILAATVRLQLESWYDDAIETGYLANGHATLKDGRYLITHNHFQIPLSTHPEKDKPELITIVTLHKANGDRILQTSLTNFRIVFEDTETLVLDIGLETGRALLAAGVRSAEFDAWDSLDLQPGMEVAQVDWDGCGVHVDWTTIKEVRADGTTPCIVLNNDIRAGASGGAVYLNGHHIGNNWLRVNAHDDAYTFSSHYSTAALNTTFILSTAGGQAANRESSVVNLTH